jgi:glucoamylase
MRIFHMADDARENEAPGAPGIAPTWTSSAKDMVSTALGSSRVWATFGYGIVNEVYWPSTGEPQIRDLGFIIKGPKGWVEVKRGQRYMMTTPKAYVPLPKVIHEGDGYRLELEYLPHPLRDGLLIRFKLDGEGVSLYVLLSPHMGGDRTDNVAWAGEDLSAQKGAVALCLRSDCGFTRTSAGYVGVSDGWQDFDKNGDMTWTYAKASGGNVALMGGLAENSGTLALTFGLSVVGARTLARSSLADDYEATKALFVSGWEDWGKDLVIPYTSPELRHAAELSAAVIKVHEDRAYAGSVVASLSIPWGQSHDDLGGYHLVWTRDAVEAALALVAVGKTDDALRVLAYLVGTQASDGSWAQNYFPSGEGYWTGNQLDEVALPTLLAAKLKAVGVLVLDKPVEDMIHRAMGYILRNGPMTDQDRWEENAGASPFTISLVLGAMVASAPFFEANERDYILSVADCWNERIESWTYVTDGEFCAQHSVSGYYVRLGPRAAAGGLRGSIDLRNRVDGRTEADGLVGLEFLHFVRTGLRRADDVRIVNTVKLIDAVLRVDTPSGPGYHRYNGDGYGEHEDGSAFDGTGIGRLWPLLTGERGHYALAAGENAQPYLDAMARMTGPGGLIPEQVWDTEAIPALGLYPGKPSGSAMPLVWAHAEFLKLLAAQANGRPAELLDLVEARWGGIAPKAATWFWRRTSPFAIAPRGRQIVFEDVSAFTLSLAVDGSEPKIIESSPSHFGMNSATIGADLPAGATRLAFTLTPKEGDAITDAIELTD